MLHLVAAVALAFPALILSVVPTVPSGIGPGSDRGPEFPAPAGYVLPWEGGRIHAVTQGEETTFTHNGLAAYAFDFNMNYDTVVAARGGRVQLVRDESNAGGCSAIFSHASNYVVIDHGDGTSGLYLHLAYDSATVEPGQIIEQGEPIAVSGETGVTCTGIEGDISPAPHLHFQVQRLSDTGGYFTQSLPVTFDDVKGDGVPREGESYVSGNYGPGKPQKIKLTPRRVERPFNPIAQPADPTFLEAQAETPTPEAAPSVAPEAPAPPPAEAVPSVDITATATGTPTPSPTEKPQHTPTREPEDETPAPQQPTLEPSTPAPDETPAFLQPPTAAPTEPAPTPAGP